MEIKDDYPLNLTRTELIETLVFLNKEIKSTLYEGEKTDLFWKIRLGQNQLLFLSLQENTLEFNNQKELLRSSITDNKITSRLNKYLTYVLICLAFITLLIQVVPLLKTDRNKVINETLIESNNFQRVNLFEIKLINSKLDSLHCTINQINNKLKEFINLEKRNRNYGK